MQQDLHSLETMLACPQCAGAMQCGEKIVHCTKCQADYSVQNGIPLFGQFGTVDHGQPTPPEQTSIPYQHAYQAEPDAAAYNAMYSDHWTKRIVTRREFAVLNRLLTSQGHCRSMLDLPCGGGRLSPSLAPHTELLIEADIAVGQVQHGSVHGRVSTRQIWMTASGFQIPLHDNAVDGVVSIRLNHHLPTAAERERLVRELLRVAGRFVIMTFFDFHSLKNTLRRVRQPFNRKPPKCTMKISDLRNLAEQCGARLVETPALFLIGSGHRYALMVKNNS